MSDSIQISDTLQGRRISLHGLELDLSNLCGATLILGSTGSGKTVSIVNPLSLALASDQSFDPDTKAAVVYFGVKGQAHLNFLNGLPQERREDVIHVRLGYSEKPFFLFSEYNWANGSQRGACIDFVLELQRHLTGSADESGNHKVYFDGIVRTGLEAFMNAEPASYPATLELRLADQELGQLFSSDALTALVCRLDAWLKHQSQRWGKKQTDLSLKRNLFERWLEQLCPESRARIQEFQDRLGDAENINQVVGVEFSSIVRIFKSDLVKGLLLDRCDAPSSYNSAWTFERIIDEGKILILDLPVSSGGLAERTLLLALAQAAMGAVLRRRHAVGLDLAMNVRRPVVFVADEFHTFLCTKGRNEGLDVFLSRCREFGAIVLLATQSIPLIHSVYRDPHRTESLLSHMRNQFLGLSLCERSNDWASRICGSFLPPPVPFLADWHQDAESQQFQLESKSPLPRLHSNELLRLKVGEFYVHLVDGTFRKVHVSIPIPSATWGS